ncbi:glutamyl-tRNA reductase [Chitinibacteraceae bacterium HSL-7]
MGLFVLGVNHQTAPLAIRERLAITAAETGEALTSLAASAGVMEAMILSTCNRTELYASAREAEALVTWLAGHRGRVVSEIEAHLYIHADDAAVRHLFRVASGLDSMVLGETQIAGQLKTAFEEAQAAGVVGPLLQHTVQRAFSVAKTVRTETRVGASSVSMAAAAVRFAERIYPTVAECSVLFIGAGEMIELCASHFCARKPYKAAVANRTFERGRSLAEQYGAEALLLTEVAERLHEFDLVVSCTASPLPVLGKGAVERALKKRRHKPMLLVDLAVPRDIEPEVSELRDAYLYTVDDLAEVVREGRAQRAEEAEAAGALVEAGVEDFRQWHAGRAVVPLIRQLRQQSERIQRHEVARAKKRLAAGDDADDVLERLSEQLVAKLLHGPLATLNAASGDEQAELALALKKLFRLHDE